MHQLGGNSSSGMEIISGKKCSYIQYTVGTCTCRLNVYSSFSVEQRTRVGPAASVTFDTCSIQYMYGVK